MEAFFLWTLTIFSLSPFVEPFWCFQCSESNCPNQCEIASIDKWKNGTNHTVESDKFQCIIGFLKNTTKFQVSFFFVLKGCVDWKFAWFRIKTTQQNKLSWFRIKPTNTVLLKFKEKWRLLNRKDGIKESGLVATQIFTALLTTDFIEFWFTTWNFIFVKFVPKLFQTNIAH